MPAQIKFTKRTVDRIESDGSDRFCWDREVPGFGLRVRASGRKFFVAQFRANGKQSTAYEYRRSVDLFIKPKIGGRKVTEIQRSDIAALHHDMRKTPY